MDTVVIGAGPVGCFAGMHSGAEVILEEHSGIGEKACGGLFSKKGIGSLGVYSKKYVLNEVRAAKFFSPKAGFEVRSRETKAYVVDRQKFDTHIAGLAEKSGCELRFNSKVKKLEKTNGNYEIVLESGERLKPKNIILACGANNFLLSQLGLAYPAKGMISTAQYEFHNGTKDDFVELHFSREFAPNFFAWKIPAGETIRVGVGVRDGSFPAVKYLGLFLKKQGIRASPVKKSSALIPLYHCCSRIRANNVMLVGDAAGQVKPTTGGGIVTGMNAARIAGEVISKNLPLSSYEKGCRGALARDFQLGLLIRKVSDRFSDRDFDRVFRVLGETALDAYIAEHGDMDTPSSLISADLVKMPGAIAKLSLAVARAYAGF